MHQQLCHLKKKECCMTATLCFFVGPTNSFYYKLRPYAMGIISFFALKSGVVEIQIVGLLWLFLTIYVINSRRK